MSAYKRYSALDSGDKFITGKIKQLAGKHILGRIIYICAIFPCNNSFTSFNLLFQLFRQVFKMI